MPRALLPRRGIFVPTMMVFNREPRLRGPPLDPAAWVALADEFESRDRIYGAAAARRRLVIFQEILAEEEDNNKFPELHPE